MTRIRSRTLTAAAVLVAAALSGCSADVGRTSADSDSAPSASAADGRFDEHDVMFAQMMIPHHLQAVQMADIMSAKPDLDPRIADLADRIREAQGPEIELLRSWLTSWDEPVEASGHAGHGMAGMMTDADLEILDAAEGEDAARHFLDQMVAHHQGAVEMAQTAAEQAVSTEVRELARRIVADQQAEIDEMIALRAEF